MIYSTKPTFFVSINIDLLIICATNHFLLVLIFIYLCHIITNHFCMNLFVCLCYIPNFFVRLNFNHYLFMYLWHNTNFFFLCMYVFIYLHIYAMYPNLFISVNILFIYLCHFTHFLLELIYILFYFYMYATLLMFLI